jgi:hypothetical protein
MPFLGISGARIEGSQVYQSPVLSRLSVSSSAAYGLRRLSASATQAIQVRRSSDNATQNIGFVGNDLDVAALLAFVGANNGFVTTWYDQVGSNNLTQATAISQPIIVNGGAVNVQNGKPSLLFQVSSSSVLANLSASSIAGATNSTLNMVSRWNINTISNDSIPMGIGQGGVTGACRCFFKVSGGTTQGYACWSLDQTTSSLTIDVGNSRVFSAVQSGSSLTLVKNGTTAAYTLPGTPAAIVSGAISLGTLYLGGVPLGALSDVDISESIIFTSALSTTDRQILERNQGAYYAISVA